MNLADFYNPRVQFLDENGNPYSGGSISFYESGTTTLTEVYTDALGTTPANNPQVLDAGGYLEQENLYLSASIFKVVLKDASGAVIWTKDPLTIENVQPAGLLSAVFYSNIANLIPIVPSADRTLAYVPGYYEAGDLGGGWFYWDATSSATPDFGTVFASVPTPASGRWIRIYEDNTVIPQHYGAIPGRTASSSESPILAAQVYCLANDKQFVIGAGTYHISGNIAFQSALNLVIEDGAEFARLSGSPTVSIDIGNDNLKQIKSSNRIRNNNTVFFTIAGTGQTRVNPIWWKSGSNSDTECWELMIQSTTDCIVILDRDWVIGPASFSGNIPPIEAGIVGSIEWGAGLDEYSIVIDRVYETVKRNDPIFYGDFKFIYIEAEQEVPVRWYDVSNTSFSEFDNILMSITQNGTHQATMLFDDGLEYKLASSFDYPEAVVYFTKFINGTTINLNNQGGNFGIIVAGDYQVFTGLPIFARCRNPELNYMWFGAVPEIDATATHTKNEAAFVRAFMFANLMDESNPILQPVISGRNGLYYVAKQLVTPEYAKTLKLKDIKFSSSLTTNSAMALYCPFDFDNVTIYSSTPATYSVLEVDGYNNTYSVSGRFGKLNNCMLMTTSAKLMTISNLKEIEISNCKLYGGSDLVINYTAGGYIKFIGNIVESSVSPYYISLTSADILFANNRIQDRIVRFKNNGVADNALNISGNIFDKTNLYIYANITNTNITGNTFNGESPRIGQIKLWGDSGRDSIDGFNVTGNTFHVTTPITSKAISLIGVSSTVSNTIVRNNVFSNIYPVKTHDISFKVTGEEMDVVADPGHYTFDFTIPADAGFLFSTNETPLTISRCNAMVDRTGDIAYYWSNFLDTNNTYELKVMQDEDGADCPTLPNMRIHTFGGVATGTYNSRYIRITGLSVTDGEP